MPAQGGRVPRLEIYFSQRFTAETRASCPGLFPHGCPQAGHSLLGLCAPRQASGCSGSLPGPGKTACIAGSSGPAPSSPPPPPSPPKSQAPGALGQEKKRLLSEPTEPRAGRQRRGAHGSTWGSPVLGGSLPPPLSPVPAQTGRSAGRTHCSLASTEHSQSDFPGTAPPRPPAQAERGV